MTSAKTSKPDQGGGQKRPVAHSFFQGMSDAHLHLLQEVSSYAEFSSGDVLFREGGPANQFYLIEHGKVGLEMDMNGEGLVQIATIPAGEPVGWSWMFPPYIWHFHARALQRTTTTCYDAVALRELCEEDSDFGYELMRRISAVMLNRLQSTRRELVKLYFQRTK